MRIAAPRGLANFKRPRRYVFVDEIPKSPVGKLLRRKLVAGEYEEESEWRMSEWRMAKANGRRRAPFAIRHSPFASFT